MDRILARQAVSDGWVVNHHLGDWDGGSKWLLRSVVARVGLGALVAEEALYYRTNVDAGGDPLTGEHRYIIHFDAGNLPPADAFWSLTPYDISTLQLTENSIDRFQTGDRTPGLVSGEDGSLTLYLSAEAPAEGFANWLPTPGGLFDIILRGYEPGQMMLRDRWIAPQPCRTDQICAREVLVDGQAIRIISDDELTEDGLGSIGEQLGDILQDGTAERAPDEDGEDSKK